MTYGGRTVAWAVTGGKLIALNRNKVEGRAVGTGVRGPGFTGCPGVGTEVGRFAEAGWDIALRCQGFNGPAEEILVAGKGKLNMRSPFGPERPML